MLVGANKNPDEGNRSVVGTFSCQRSGNVLAVRVVFVVVHGICNAGRAVFFSAIRLRSLTRWSATICLLDVDGSHANVYCSTPGAHTLNIGINIAHRAMGTQRYEWHAVHTSHRQRRHRHRHFHVRTTRVVLAAVRRPAPRVRTMNRTGGRGDNIDIVLSAQRHRTGL